MVFSGLDLSGHAPSVRGGDTGLSRLLFARMCLIFLGEAELLPLSLNIPRRDAVQSKWQNYAYGDVSGLSAMGENPIVRGVPPQCL